MPTKTKYIALIGMAALGALSGSARALDVDVNIGGPVVVENRHWAPLRTYTRRVPFRYYPDCGVYYNPDEDLYYYLEDGDWIVSEYLPDYIRYELGPFVYIDLDRPDPRYYDDVIVRRYPRRYTIHRNHVIHERPVYIHRNVIVHDRDRYDRHNDRHDNWRDRDRHDNDRHDNDRHDNDHRNNYRRSIRNDTERQVIRNENDNDLRNRRDNNTSVRREEQRTVTRPNTVERRQVQQPNSRPTPNRTVEGTRSVAPGNSQARGGAVRGGGEQGRGGGAERGGNNGRGHGGRD